MKKTIQLLLLGFGLLVLSGCTRSTTPAPTATESVGNIAPTPTIVMLPTAADRADTDTCLNCHTVKQRLIDTAKPEEPAEEESEGVG